MLDASEVAGFVGPVAASRFGATQRTSTSGDAEAHRQQQ